jgi:mRNA interferase RelE/StbE
VDNRVAWHPDALNAAAGYLKDDPVGVAQVFTVTDTLADDPRVGEAFPMGKNRYRLRVGSYRVVYEIRDDNTILVEIVHRGRRSDQ